MKPIIKKRIITLTLLISAVIGMVEFQKFIKRQDPACVDGSCKIPSGHGLVINPFPLETPAKPAKQPLPQLIDFGAGKCATCKMMNVVLEELSAEHGDRLNIQFVDVWEDKEASEAHSIRMIPTQIFLDAKGNELFRHEGFISKEDIVKQWAELGYVFDEPQNIEQGTPNSEGLR